jgi:uncharacterized protein with HEPN domain
LKTERAKLLVKQIRRECEAGLAFVEGVDRADFLMNSLLQHAVSMSLVAVGEYTARLVQVAPDFIAAHPEIPWTSIVGMRDRIAHGYFGLDFEVVWDTVQTSIPELLARLPCERA